MDPKGISNSSYNSRVSSITRTCPETGIAYSSFQLQNTFSQLPFPEIRVPFSRRTWENCEMFEMSPKQWDKNIIDTRIPSA